MPTIDYPTDVGIANYFSHDIKKSVSLRVGFPGPSLTTYLLTGHPAPFTVLSRRDIDSQVFSGTLFVLDKKSPSGLQPVLLNAQQELRRRFRFTPLIPPLSNITHNQQVQRTFCSQRDGGQALQHNLPCLYL